MTEPLKSQLEIRHTQSVQVCAASSNYSNHVFATNTAAPQSKTLVTKQCRSSQLRTMDCILFVAPRERDCYIPMPVLKLGATGKLQKLGLAIKGPHSRPMAGWRDPHHNPWWDGVTHTHKTWWDGVTHTHNPWWDGVTHIWQGWCILN